jgi:Fur family peroxide stress response transcriptional regulator
MTSSRKKIATSGLASTRQRVFILKAIQGRIDHPDAETVHQAVISSLPSISLDTVYRTLSLFAKKGLIQQLAVPTRRSRYDGNPKPHDHFLCTRCERIADIPGVASVSARFLRKSPESARCSHPSTPTSASATSAPNVRTTPPFPHKCIRSESSLPSSTQA